MKDLLQIHGVEGIHEKIVLTNLISIEAVGRVFGMVAIICYALITTAILLKTWNIQKFEDFVLFLSRYVKIEKRKF
jgi:hypothetical protein